ncbi:hypothetical protein PVAND_000313 [Polypedilum vanderplanki]|uniref:Uncharacterized protein n=1 Tax=Polypedilum vanderplanki TaxID=319348 RepID=A0A9J6BJX4_POLVA|nr:hypothetical protein PVAND_000313 [Polypedilum vanderplanki]
MKYYFAVLLLCYTATAVPSNEEKVQAAQYNSLYPYNDFYYQQPMFNKPNDKFIIVGSPEKFLKMKNKDFPTDPSLPCSNTCGCRQACAVMWYMPCTCACPPICGCVDCIKGCCGEICCEDVPKD